MFKERVGPIIDKEWAASVLEKRAVEEDETLPKPPDEATRMPPVPISFRNSVLKRLLKAEPSEIHEEIEVWRKAHHVVKCSNEDESAEDDGKFEKADGYHR